MPTKLDHIKRDTTYPQTFDIIRLQRKRSPKLPSYVKFFFITLLLIAVSYMAVLAAIGTWLYTVTR
jgi:hypothetical protein